MEYLYRALNDFDLEINPNEHGLINKEIIENNLSYAHQFSFYLNPKIWKICDPYSLSKKENKSFYESIKKSYLPGMLPLIKYEINKKQHTSNVLYAGTQSDDYHINTFCEKDLVEIFLTAEAH